MHYSSLFLSAAMNCHEQYAACVVLGRGSYLQVSHPSIQLHGSSAMQNTSIVECQSFSRQQPMDNLIIWQSESFVIRNFWMEDVRILQTALLQNYL